MECKGVHEMLGGRDKPHGNRMHNCVGDLETCAQYETSATLPENSKRWEAGCNLYEALPWTQKYSSNSIKKERRHRSSLHMNYRFPIRHAYHDACARDTVVPQKKKKKRIRTAK